MRIKINHKLQASKRKIWISLMVENISVIKREDLKN